MSPMSVSTTISWHVALIIRSSKMHLLLIISVFDVHLSYLSIARIDSINVILDLFSKNRRHGISKVGLYTSDQLHSWSNRQT